MTEPPTHGEDILIERLLHMDERALPRAVAEVFERGDGNEDVHLRAWLPAAHPTSVVSVTPGMPPTGPSTGCSTR